MPYNLRNRKIIHEPTVVNMSEPSNSECDVSEPQSECISEPQTECDSISEDVSESDEYTSIISDEYDSCEEDDLPYDLFMTSEYMMEAWKSEVDPEKIEELEIELRRQITEMRSQIPTVQTILESDLTDGEKQLCLYRLDMLKNSDPYESDFLTNLAILVKRLNPKYYLLQRCMNAKNIGIDTQILQLEADDATKITLLNFYANLGTNEDSEYRNKITKLEKFVKLPYNRIRVLSDEPIDVKLQKASEFLDKEIYKMDGVKRKILSVLSNYLNTQKFTVFALLGDPGVGKTHIASVISKCIGLPFYQITLGGSEDLNILLGSDSGWVGSNTGELANAYIHMGSSNGVILIDELDKASPKIWNAINHIIDPVTNMAVKDYFLREVDIDCSRTIFVISLNDKNVFPKYLLSRINVINVESPSISDKFEITKLYKIPKLQIPGGITFTNDAIMALVNLSSEKGYREIDGFLNHVCECLNMHYIMRDKLSTFRHCIIKDFKMPFECDKSHISILTKSFVEKNYTHTMYN